MEPNLKLPIWVLQGQPVTIDGQTAVQQLEAWGLPFSIIPVGDPTQLTAADLARYSARAACASLGRGLRQPEIADALAHAKLWQRLVDEKHPEALIVTAGVRLSRALVGVLANRQRFPSGADLINFATPVPQLPFGDYVSEIYRVSAHQTDPLGIDAYWITQRGAQKLLAQSDPIRWPADQLTARTYLTGLVSYGIYPNVAMAPSPLSAVADRHTPQAPPCRGWRLQARYHAGRSSYRVWRNALRQIGQIIAHGVLKRVAKAGPPA